MDMSTYERIAGPAKAGWAKQIDDCLRAAMACEDTGYRDHVARLRAHYDGKYAHLVKRALARKFPSTHQQMTMANISLARFIADHDAAVYDYAARRGLRLSSTGEPLEAGDPYADRFAAVVEQSNLDAVLLEGNRKLALARSLVLRVSWDTAKDRAHVDQYWPDAIYPVPHWRYRTDPDRLIALTATVAGPTGDKWYEHWWRSLSAAEAADDTGWHSVLVSDKGVLAPGSRSDGMTPDGTAPVWPWVFWHHGLPEAGPFVDRDRDLADALESIHVQHADELHTVACQAHGQGYITGLRGGDSVQVGGPGNLVAIPDGSTLGVLNWGADIEQIRKTRQTMLREIAVSRRMAEDAYSTERTGAPLTGVSRRVKNEPQDKARREDAIYARAMETRYLLPTIMRMHDAYTSTRAVLFDGHPTGVTPWMVENEPPDFEDPLAKTQRIVAAMGAGLISPARAAAELGIYESEHAAAQAGLSLTLGSAGNISP